MKVPARLVYNILYSTGRGKVLATTTGGQRQLPRRLKADLNALGQGEILAFGELMVHGPLNHDFCS